MVSFIVVLSICDPYLDYEDILLFQRKQLAMNTHLSYEQTLFYEQQISDEIMQR